MEILKKIVYIDYFEHKEKIKNVGHVKIWIKEGSCILDIHIRGLYPTDTFMADIRAIEGQGTIGRLCVDKGTAYFNGTYKADDIDGEGNSFEVFGGIHIHLSDTRYLEARWSESGQNIVKEHKKTTKTKETPREELHHQVETSPVLGQQKQEESKQKQEESKQKKEKKPAENIQKKALEAAEHTEQEQFFEEKWDQLCHTYAVVYPFVKDPYISITPKDFTVLRREYQQLVNNSFLLHGYYNYKHLILGKALKKCKEVYLLGVPGTYYEREKMAAVMFGFESFELPEQEFSDDPIEEGAYGYYLRSVEI